MKKEIELNISGRVEINVKRKSEEQKIKQKNNIDITFASTLGALLLFGTNSPYAGPYATTFSLPQSIVILLLNNGTIVAQMQTTLQGLTDNLTNIGETTSITFIGSDSTTSQYTFNELQLYTVVNNVLFMKVAEVYLQSPITKGQNDQIQVTWQIIASSAIPFANISTVAPNDCNATCSQSAECQTNWTLTNYKASIFNFMVALLLVPGLFKVLQNQQVPMSTFTSALPTVTQILGVNQILFFDACLNDAGIWVVTTNQVASAGETAGNNYVYVSLNVVFTPSLEVSYMMPFIEVSGNGVALGYPLAFIAVQGASIPNQAQTFGILLKIPYGQQTLVSVSETT
jgi:hypothetical protein